MMINLRKLDPIHKKILTKLFSFFKKEYSYNILDLWSGRTSLKVLTEYFKNSKVTAIIYPWDIRKSKWINESVKTKNFILKEQDIYKLKQEKKYDIILAHLLLWEANKFSNKPFEQMVESLFKIQTKYLIIIDILEDKDVDYRTILSYISKKWEMIKTITLNKYIWFLIKKQ